MSAVPASTPANATVSHSDWREILVLLDTALEFDLAGRAHWLELLGPEHARLIPTLRELLNDGAALADSGFMQSSPAGRLGPLSSPTPAPELAPQSRVGPYRLLREIGQGGMASVWLAERADGLLDRQVALKLPHISWGSGSFAERMARERNILASLTHPNIARLYDAGLADDGRPYLAMEYIDGQPIDVHAARGRLTVAERVELLLQVAHAVAHAHAHLVVHRDLKPSNILVDAQGQVHLLDFGIAKLIDPDGHDETRAIQATLVPGRALTPDYASPEQIRGDSLGTASDVYSLGVVAYELLAGSKPYRLSRGSAADLDAQLMQTEVARASTLATDAPARLALKGDLDAVLAKALKKQPALRYATVNEFAAELDRHLSGQAVLARHDSWLYVWQRRLWRHRLPLGVSAAVLLSFGLALGPGATALVAAVSLVGLVVSWWQAERARQRGLRAEREAAKARAVKDFLLAVFNVGRQSIDGRLAGEVTLLDAMNLARSRIGPQLQRHAGVRRELLESLAAVYQTLDRPKENFELLQAALEAQQEDPDALPDERAALLSKLIQGAFYHSRFEHLQAWIDDLDAAVASAADPGSERAAELLYFRGRWLGAQGRPMAEVLPWLQQADALFAAHHPASPRRIHLLNRLVQCYIAEDRSDDALRTADESIDLTEQIARLTELDVDAMDLPNSLSVRGLLKLQMNLPGPARQDLQRADALYRSLTGDEYFLTLQNQAMLARALVACGDAEEGLALARRAEAAVARLRPGQPTHCKTLEHWGLALLAAGRPAEAVQVLVTARQAWRALGDAQAVHAASTVIALADAHLRCADLAAADEALAWVEALDAAQGLPHRRVRRLLAEQRVAMNARVAASPGT